MLFPHSDCSSPPNIVAKPNTSPAKQSSGLKKTTALIPTACGQQENSRKANTRRSSRHRQKRAAPGSAPTQANKLLPKRKLLASTALKAQGTKSTLISKRLHPTVRNLPEHLTTFNRELARPRSIRK